MVFYTINQWAYKSGESAKVFLYAWIIDSRSLSVSKTHVLEIPVTDFERAWL